MSGGYGPPLIDAFGMISGLGDAYRGGLDRAVKQRELELQRQAQDEGAKLMLSAIGQPAPPAGLASSPIAALGQTAAAPSFAAGGAPRAMAMPAGDAAGVRDRFISTVKGAGLTNPVGLAAVAAYGQAESGYAPGNVNRTWSDPSQSGQAGTSGGIMSWRNERLASLRAFAQNNGDNPQSPSVETQAKFLASEDPNLIPRLNSAKTPEEANQIMAQAWRFAGYDQPGGENARRLNMTKAYASRFGGMNVAPNQTSQADVPAPGAQSAQGFAIPGQAQAPAAQNPAAGIPPHVREMLQSQNPYVRQQGAAEARAYLQKANEPVNYGFTTLPDGTVLRQDPRRGAVEPVYQAQPKPETSTVSPGATLVDQRTGRVIYQGAPKDEAPTVRTVKQPDGSEVAVQWDQQARQWVPLPAPQGGNAVRDPKLTETQSKDLNYYERGAGALPTLNKLENELLDGFANVARRVPGGNYLQTPEYQQANTASELFVSSILRKDTGAAVTPQEMELYGKMFLPQPGDKPPTVALKREARARALAGIRKGLGTAQAIASAFPETGGTRPTPQGVDPKVWGAMTPEERALWN